MMTDNLRRIRFFFFSVLVTLWGIFSIAPESCAESGTTPQPQYLTFSHGVVRTPKEPTQHSRLGGSFGLGDVGDTLGISKVGIGIGMDTFWAVHGGNQKTDITMKVAWNFSKDELNDYNVGFAGKYLIPRVPLGSITVTTHEFHYQRQLGFSTKIGLDFNIQGTWHNNIGSQSIADLGIDINDTANEKIGPNTGRGNDPGVYGTDAFYHSDTLMITDLAGLVNGAATKIVNLLEKIGVSALKGYGASVTKTLAEKAFEKVLGFSLGVNATQRTYNRNMGFDIAVSAKDMDNKPVAVTLDADAAHIAVNDESREYIIYANFPQECPPLKEVTLNINNAVYHYKEQGNVEVGLRSSYIALTTGAVSQDLFDPSEHNIDASNSLRFTIKADPLLFVPFTGLVVTGSPETGIQGAKVTMTATDGSFVQSALTGPDGMFFGDFYTPNPKGLKAVPPFGIKVEKESFSLAVYNTTADIPKTADGKFKLTITPSDPNSIITVSGRVTDNQARPVSGAEVFVSGKLSQYTTTASDGTYRFGSVLRSNKIEVHAQKSGYLFEPQVASISPRSNVKDYTADFQSQMAQLTGAIKIKFTTVAGASLPVYVDVKHEDGRTYACGVASDGTLGISVFDSTHKAVTLSRAGYEFTPSNISANFSGDTIETKTFNVSVTPTTPHTIILSSNRGTIEGGGSYFDNPRFEETAVLTAFVKDAAGRGLPGVNVRFDLISVQNVGQPKFSSTDPAFGTSRGYAVTDAQGKATISVWSANTTLSGANLKMNARAFLPGMPSEQSQVISSDLTIAIIPSNRAAQPNKPTATVSVTANNRAVTGMPQPTIEAGGGVIFNLSAAVGNPAGVPLMPAGTIVGYKVGTSKDNGQWQDTDYPGFPPASLPQTFDQKGEYKVGFMVQERCGTKDVWSDRAQAQFSVVEYTPPTVVLTIPQATGAVNIPVNYSFNVIANGSTLKNITLEFGDNQMDFNIDSGILSGKSQWSGSYHHTYAQQGTYTIRLAATDQTNRTSETTQVVTIGSVASLNDNTAPTGSVAINNGAATTAALGVSVHITASDNAGGSGIYRYRTSSDGSNWSQWNSVNWPDDTPVQILDINPSFQLSGGSGQKTVYIQLKDAADNVSSTITDSIELTASGITIGASLPPPQAIDTYYQNAPAPHGSISITGRNGNNISATFSATNDWAIGVNQMALSFDGTNWTAWMPLEDNKQIDLSGHLDATKLYVTYGDRAGGQSPAYSANIPAASGGGAVTQQSTQTQDASGTGQGAQTQATATQGQSTQAQATQAGAQGQAGSGTVLSAGTTQKGGASAGAGLGSKADRSGQRLQKATADAGRLKATAQATKSQPLTETVREETKKEEPVDISLEGLKFPPTVYLSQKVEVEVGVKNNSAVEIKDCVVTFSSGDGASKKEKISLRPRAKERVKFEWTPLKEGRQKILAAIEYKEDTNPANNQVSETIEVKAKAPIDLSISDMRLPREFIAEKSSDIEAVVKNDSDSEIRDCQVNFEAEDGFRDQKRISLRPRGQEKVKFSWTPKKEGRQKITATLQAREDDNPRNNAVTQTAEVKPPAGSGKLGGSKGASKIILEEDLKR